MSEAVIIAAFLVCAGAIGWLTKLFVDHLRECRKIQADAATSFAMIIATLERIDREIEYERIAGQRLQEPECRR